METGSKKHIIAEHYFETEIADSLCNLYVCNYSDFKVLSLYADLNKRFIAYKILHQGEHSNEVWLNTDFNRIIEVDLNPEFTLVPLQFETDSKPINQTIGFSVQGTRPIQSNHFVYGIAQYNFLNPEPVKVFLFKQEGLVNVLIFKDRNCVFSNVFNCQNETEILYFVVSALQTSDCQQAQTALYLDYALSIDSKTLNFFTPYFQSVSHLKLEMEQLDQEILHLPELLFINYAMSLCE